MPIPQIAIVVLVAIIAGGISISVLGTGKGVPGIDFLVALIGAYLMNWISYVMTFPFIVPITYNKSHYEFIWALIGAFLFIFLLRFSSDQGS